MRQNFTLADVGAPKALALAARLSDATKAAVTGFETEAHSFLLQDLNRTSSYDLIIDCTASQIFQMRLEREWARFGGKMPRYAAFVIDARAERILGLELAAGSPNGPYVGYLQLKNTLCHTKGIPKDFLDAFYSADALEHLFQPEPGCSDPTFAGSAADTAAAAATFLNLIAIPNKGLWGYALSAHAPGTAEVPLHKIVQLDQLTVVENDAYRILLSPTVYASARACVADNNRTRSRKHETGGLLWGHWDEAAGTIVVFEASGPPPDSKHDPGHFVCGTKGTKVRHEKVRALTRGASGFIGMWHTHPDMTAKQSGEDVMSMCALVSGISQNQRRGLMVIFGRPRGQPEVGLYAYESLALDHGEQVVGRQVIATLTEAVV